MDCFQWCSPWYAGYHFTTDLRVRNRLISQITRRTCSIHHNTPLSIIDVHIFCFKMVYWDMGYMHSGICEICLSDCCENYVCSNFVFWSKNYFNKIWIMGSLTFCNLDPSYSSGRQVIRNLKPTAITSLVNVNIMGITKPGGILLEQRMSFNCNRKNLGSTKMHLLCTFITFQQWHSSMFPSWRLNQAYRWLSARLQ